ncbi:MAG: hypothetical protein PHW10_03600 [Candidatus Peribacteraceae bacterium]|nr:hypothetical protein [Candidatus Peribacteraceae bacterium]
MSCLCMSDIAAAAVILSLRAKMVWGMVFLGLAAVLSICALSQHQLGSWDFVPGPICACGLLLVCYGFEERPEHPTVWFEVKRVVAQICGAAVFLIGMGYATVIFGG